MKFLILLLLCQNSISEELKRTKNSYLFPLMLEPSYIDKGETYLNLSVTDIRLNNLNNALKEAKIAELYDRKSESTYLQGVIYYLLDDKEKARAKFKKIDRWQYAYFLENLYGFSEQKERLPVNDEFIPDSLRFYFIFYESDTSKIRGQIENSKLPSWQYMLGKGYLSYKDGEYRKALNYFLESYNLKREDYTGVFILASQFRLSELDSLLSFQKKYSIVSPLANYLKGEALYKKGWIERATELFLSDTNSPYRTHAIFASGWSKYRLAQYSESADLFQKFLNIYQQGELRQFALYRLARGLLKQGKVESLTYFKKIVEEYPDSPLKDDAYLLLGKINFLLNRFDEATKWFKSLLSEFPDSPWVGYTYRYLGSISASKNDFNQALYYYSKILGSEDLSIGLIDEACYRIEEIKWKMGKYLTKISMFKGFIEKYPESPRTPSLLLQVGDYYKAAARYQKAIQFFKKVLKSYPDSEEADESLRILGKLYQLIGKEELAVDLLKKALQERPELEEEIQLELGNIYYKIEEPEEAIKYYKEITSSKLLPYAQYQIGTIYYELGLFREVRVPLKVITDKFPDSEYFNDAYLLLAKTYLQEGSLKKTIEVVNEGLNKLKGKEKGTLLSFKANIYCRMNDKEALDLYLKSAEMMGDDINGTVKILEEAKKCAIRLNEQEKKEYIQNIIEVLKTHKED